MSYLFSGFNRSSINLLGLIVLVIIMILVPLFVHNPYYIHLLIMVGINSVLAMTFILLFRTGLISLAIAAFWGIGAYASAMLVGKLGMPFWLSLPLSAVITGLVALVTGCLLVKKGGMSFVIQTMVFGFIIVLVFGTFDVFGGHEGIYGITGPETIPLPFFGIIEFTTKTQFYYLMLFLVILVTTAFWAFYSTWTGRAWRAIGLSPRLAESLGIDLFTYRLLAFVITAAASGLMGSFYAHYYGSIIPSTFDPLKTIYTHIYAILGGINFALLGPILGSLIMTIVPEFLRITRELEPIFTGFFVILLVMFFPDGLTGLLSGWRRRPLVSENKAGRRVRWMRAFLTAKNSGPENEQ